MRIMRKLFIFTLLIFATVILLLSCIYYEHQPKYNYLIGKMYHYRQGSDLQTIRKFFEKSVALLEEQYQDSNILGMAYCDLAEISIKLGDLDKGKIYLEKVVPFLTKDDAKHLYARLIMMYRNYAIELEEREMFGLSEIYFRKALALVKPNSPEHFSLIESLGISCSNQGKYEEATKYYSTALEFFEKSDDIHGKTYTLNLMAYLHFRQNHPKESLEYALQALDNLDAIIDLSMKAAILDTIASAYELNKDYQNGEKYMREAINQLTKSHEYNPKRKASYFMRLGNLLKAQGKEEQANQAWSTASTLLKPLHENLRFTNVL